MRPDIDAGPIGRKCSVSNGWPAGSAAAPCSDRPTSGRPVNMMAAASATPINRYSFIVSGLPELVARL